MQLLNGKTVSFQMKTTEIILIFSVVLIVAVRLYKKYSEKNKPDARRLPEKDDLKISEKDDEYEPYAGRRR